LLVSLTSPSAVGSEYCKLERRMFAQEATAQAAGLCLGEHHRIFNVLLNNIPHEEWPRELGVGREATSAFKLYEVTPQDDFGVPSEPRAEGGSFNTQLNALVAALRTTLVKVQALPGPLSGTDTAGTSPESSVFVAEVSEGMRRHRRGLIKSLKESGRHVVTNIPPPHAAAKHDRKVCEALAQCGLSIHLLNQSPGEEMEDDENEAYPQRQTDLALAHGKGPFIWIPKELDLEAVESSGYREFLSGVERQAPPSACFCRGISANPSHEEIFDQVLRCLEERQPDPSPGGGECLVNYHEQEDAFSISELTDHLFDRDIRCRLVPQADREPEKGRRIYEARIKTASAVIILFGKVSHGWVGERLRVGQQYFALRGGAAPRFIVCAFPPEKSPDALRTFTEQPAQIAPIHVMERFAPDRLSALLEEAGIGGAP
jgi:hypothetical protein